MGKLMLWIVPRSKSTIILKSLSSNQAIKCIFEPFAFAYFSYFYDNQFTFDDLREMVEKEPFTNDNIVWKDVPYFVENHDFASWFKGTDFKHALLVRHPKEVALSNIIVNGETKHFMDIPRLLKEHSKIHENYDVMLKLRNFLTESGSEWRVFDSTDLGSDNCAEFIESLCQFADLPFEKESMLSMKTSEDLPCSWWKPPTAHKIKDNSIMNLDLHSAALKSEEFKSNDKDNSPELSEEDQTYLDEILELSMPIYNELISSHQKMT